MKSSAAGYLRLSNANTATQFLGPAPNRKALIVGSSINSSNQLYIGLVPNPTNGQGFGLGVHSPPLYFTEDNCGPLLKAAWQAISVSGNDSIYWIETLDG